ncbi:MAG: hypothetical protein LBM03_01515 [Erysipelotrichaceae bacterium]|jgi:hypothetical protein|nr:hypothetical protein [Erysipelotrichaceae bacterium]
MKISKKTTNKIVFISLNTILSSIIGIIVLLSLTFLSNDTQYSLFLNANKFSIDKTNPVAVRADVEFDEAKTQSWINFANEYNDDAKFYNKSQFFSVTDNVQIDDQYSTITKTTLIDLSVLKRDDPLYSTGLVILSYPEDRSFEKAFEEEEGYLKVVVSQSDALSITQSSSYEETIGKTFAMNIEGQLINVKIGGCYNEKYPAEIFKNAYYYKNFEHPMFFLRNENTSFIKRDYIYVTLADNITYNKSIYNDIRYFESMVGELDFYCPSMLANNETLFGDIRFSDFLEYINDVNSKIIYVGVTFLILGIINIVAQIVLFRKKKTKTYLISLFGGYIVIPPLVLYLLRTIKVAGIDIPTLSPLAGWFLISFGILAAIMFVVFEVKIDKDKTQNTDNNNEQDNVRSIFKK